MTSNSIHATYTETYDLNTINGELSILGIHTPQAPALRRMFHGLMEQYRKVKILGCNFKLVCASRQELTPDLIGVGASKISARDVLNPILFKACTGEGMNVLLDQIYNPQEEESGSNGSSISEHRDTGANAFGAYYSLLADDSFRREHPQKGITVMGLKPYVHRIVSTQPFKWSGIAPDGVEQPYITPQTSGPGSEDNFVGGFGAQSGSKNYTIDPVNGNVFVSNGLTDMPWFDTALSYVVTDDVDNTKVQKMYNLISKIPRVYMGVLILPPSESAVNLYYRLQIVWHIAFKDFRPAQDLMPISQALTLENSTGRLGDAGSTYFNLYHTASKLEKEYGSFDTQGVEQVEVVGEKVN